MEKEINQKLIEFAQFLQDREYLVRRSWQEALNEFDDSINCLESKPKALHSMKCDEKYCECGLDIPRGGYGDSDLHCGNCGLPYEQD